MKGTEDTRQMGEREGKERKEQENSSQRGEISGHVLSLEECSRESMQESPWRQLGGHLRGHPHSTRAERSRRL